MIIRQLNEDLRRDIQFTAFIVAVHPLAARQDLSHLCLRQIAVLAQISNTFIYHTITPSLFYGYIIW